VPDQEIVELRGGSCPSNIQITHGASARPGTDSAEQLLKQPFRTFSPDFHGAVAAIPDPSDQTQSLCGAEGEITKAHALDISVDDNVDGLFTSFFAHLKFLLIFEPSL
jgi:hypothetical protein